MKKGFAPIIILLGITIIAVLVGGVLVYTNYSNNQSKLNPQPTPTSTSDETANWKTYTNKKYGFSFKYPSNWVENEGKIEEKLGVNGVNALTQKGIAVEVYENSGKLSALEFLDTIFYKDYNEEGLKGLKEIYMKQYQENSYLEPIAIDGKSATYIEQLTIPSGSKGSGVWVAVKNNGFFLRGYPTEGTDEIFKQILSTVKFLDTI